MDGNRVGGGGGGRGQIYLSVKLATGLELKEERSRRGGETQAR